MSNGLSFIIVVVLALVILVGGGIFVVFSKVEPNETIQRNTDSVRKLAVTGLASSINHYYTQAHAGVITDDWQQLGTATDGCELSTTHCQFQTTACLNLGSALGKSIPLPVDAATEDQQKTGYAVRLVSQEMVEIKACFTEADQPIVQRVNIK